MHAITSADIRLLKEYRDAPSSRHHSLDLKRLLTLLRVEPTALKVFIYVVEPGRDYALGQLGAKRGDPIAVFPERYPTFRQAEWALLKSRWLKHSGLDWPAELDA